MRSATRSVVFIAQNNENALPVILKESQIVFIGTVMKDT